MNKNKFAVGKNYDTSMEGSIAPAKAKPNRVPRKVPASVINKLKSPIKDGKKIIGKNYFPRKKTIK